MVVVVTVVLIVLVVGGAFAAGPDLWMDLIEKIKKVLGKEDLSEEGRPHSF